MQPLVLDLPAEEATLTLGQDLAAALRPGDVIALSGDLGAGKSTLARAVIRALAGDASLEVPSPTFTLVQDYAARFPVRHFDLYRLSGPDELEELGFDDMADGVALIEWPQRAGDLLADAVIIELEEFGRGRRATISGPALAMARIARSLEIRAFLDRAGWQGAHRAYLQGDASARAYEIASLPGRPDAILMNAPRQPDGPPIRDGLPYSRIARLAESVTPFVAIDSALRAAGFAAPEILAQNLGAGLLLIEHLGAEPFLEDGRPVPERYRAAAELLADMHAVSWPAEIVVEDEAYAVPPYDRAAMLIETELLLDWYVPYVTGHDAGETTRAAFSAAWNAVLDRLAGAQNSLVLRDYHSPNLVWRGKRTGNDRLGLVDFQDALMGPAAYDVASLAMDARVDIDAEIERDTVEAYCARMAGHGAFDRTAFGAAYAIMAAQRNSKILGIFVRLDRRDGKPHYLKHLPRIRDYLARTISHPALAEVADLYRRLGVIT